MATIIQNPGAIRKEVKTATLNLYGGVNNYIYVTAKAPKYYLEDSVPTRLDSSIRTSDVEYGIEGNIAYVKSVKDGESNISLRINSTYTENGKLYYVTKIAPEAFYKVKTIQEITIPSTIQEIGYAAFRECSSLSIVKFEDDNRMPIFLDSTGWSNGPNASVTYKLNASDSETSVPDEQMIQVGDSKIYALYVPAEAIEVSIQFYNDDNVTSMIKFTDSREIDALPNCLFSLVNTNETAEGQDGKTRRVYSCKYDFTYNPGTDFLGFNGLRIGDSAFMDTALTYEVNSQKGIDNPLVLPRRTVSIGPNAFFRCRLLGAVKLPKRNRLVKVGDKAFIQCTALTTISLEEGVKEIGYEAFRECSNLYGFACPDSVTDIGANAFHTAGGLSYLYFNQGTVYGSQLRSIGRYAFYRCGALGSLDYNKIILPVSLKFIGFGAFAELSPTARRRGLNFQEPSTWFTASQDNDDNINNVPANQLNLVDPWSIWSNNTDPNDSLDNEITNAEYILGGMGTQYNWYRLDNMIAPEVELTDDKLVIIDKLGLAEEFTIYVTTDPNVSYKSDTDPKTIPAK